jgi:hemolysin III
VLLSTREFEGRIDEPFPVITPRLRGVTYLAAFVVAAPVGVALVLHARGGVAVGGAVVFATSVVLMIGVSILLHRREWTPERKRWIRFLDHTSIYVLIAGTYTPLALLVLDDGWRLPMLAIVWGGALLAAAARLLWPDAPPWVVAATCVALGWVSVVVMRQIVDRIGAGATALLVASGIVYTAGAVVYARRRPDPFPNVFGYHEVFHALVLVALTCQYATIAFFVLPQA